MGSEAYDFKVSRQEFCVGLKVGAAHRTDGYAQGVEWDFQHLCELRDQKALGIALNQYDAACEQNFRAGDISGLILDFAIFQRKEAVERPTVPSSGVSFNSRIERKGVTLAICGE